jgi:hypothetical protein
VWDESCCYVVVRISKNILFRQECDLFVFIKIPHNSDIWKWQLNDISSVFSFFCNFEIILRYFHYSKTIICYSFVKFLRVYNFKRCFELVKFVLKDFLCIVKNLRFSTRVRHFKHAWNGVFFGATGRIHFLQFPFFHLLL